MDLTTIREAVQRQPFRPFILRMNDGREFHIVHPEWISVLRRDVIVVNREDEVVIHLEPVLIASLQEVQPTSDSGEEQGQG